jgi:hypothetical protein
MLVCPKQAACVIAGADSDEAGHAHEDGPDDALRRDRFQEQGCLFVEKIVVATLDLDVALRPFD